MVKGKRAEPPRGRMGSLLGAGNDHLAVDTEAAFRRFENLDKQPRLGVGWKFHGSAENIGHSPDKGGFLLNGQHSHREGQFDEGSSVAGGARIGSQTSSS